MGSYSILYLILSTIFVYNLYLISMSCLRNRERREIIREPEARLILDRNHYRPFEDSLRQFQNNFTPRVRVNMEHFINRNILPIMRRNGLNLPDVTSRRYIQYPEPAAENNESENSGLTLDQIERFPTRIANNDIEQKCSICLDNFKRGDKLRRLPCLHEFHTNCIDRWLINNNKCPIDNFCCN